MCIRDSKDFGSRDTLGAAEARQRVLDLAELPARKEKASQKKARRRLAPGVSNINNAEENRFRDGMRFIRYIELFKSALDKRVHRAV